MSKKPTPKVTPTPEDPAVSDKPTPIKFEDNFVSVAGLASKGRDALLHQLRQHREREEAKRDEYKPPARTERQLEQLRLEMEAGRRASEKAAAQAAVRPTPKREPSDGYTTPVFRPGDHVPNINSPDPQARTVKEG